MNRPDLRSLPAPESSFASDNAAGVAPEVLDALLAANTPAASPYGADPWTARAVARLRELFDSPVEVLWCWGGTGANVVGLASLLEPWQAVVCPSEAHLVVDECGAPARFTGATIIPVPCPDGKLRPEALDAYRSWRDVEHHPQPAVVSVSQVTEAGTVYSVDELGALGEAARSAGLRLHVDGARIANAVAATGAGVRAMLVDTGVDVLTFGATKNGAMYGEAVVFLRPELARAARFVRKQAGQLPSKARFVAAQFEALLTEDRWLRYAATANRRAADLAAAVTGLPGVDLLRPPEANALFARLPPERVPPLQDWSFFWPWDDTGVVRWMTSFATSAADIDRFAAGVAAATGSEDRP